MTCAVEWCDRKPHARGWCNRHYMRWARGLDPAGEGYDPEGKFSWVVRLVMTYPTGRCVDWPWGTDKRGYGQIARTGKGTKVSHLVLVLCGRPRPSIPGYHGACALHSCDRPVCCAPWHLRWGTQQENADDRDRRGRAHYANAVPADAVNAIRARREAGGTYEGIAADFGVAPATVWQIVNRMRAVDKR